MRRLGVAIGLGALFGLALFLLEGAALLREGAIGLDFDTQGPFAALFAAVRPLLPALLARVLVVYLVAGGVLGAAASALAGAVLGTSARRSAFFGLVAAEWLVLAGSLAWLRAVQRPALFDDLGWLQGPLGWLVLHGQPWHAQLLLGGWGLGHAALGLSRSRARLARVRWGRVALAVAALVLVLGVSLPRGPAAPQPLVVLIGVDALRPDRLAVHGGKGGVLPNLDAFAHDATVFDRAYTGLAQTEPAWRSLVTSRWPPTTGVRYPLTADARRVELPTVPAALEQAGVHTWWGTDCSRFNFLGPASGFGTRVQPPRGAINFALEKLRFRALGVVADNALGAAWLPEFVDNRALAGIYDPAGYAERLSHQLLSAAGKGPTFFAWHSTAAHFPGDPSFPFYRAFVRPDAPLKRKLRMSFTPIGAGAVAKPEGWTRADSEALYDELQAQGDAQVGALLQALKRDGRYEGATIIVFSDHGESFHPDVEALGGATPVHGARLGAEENQIVLLIKPAGGRHVERVSRLVRLLDLGPTVLEAAGLKPLPGVDGRSLAPLLEGKDDPPRLLYAETGYTHASPAAFDPGHATGAPRTFDAYQVLPDGLVQMSQAAHEGVMKEKDFGAFDGEHWLVRSPRADGTIAERCDGNCEALGSFLDDVLKPRLAAGGAE